MQIASSRIWTRVTGSVFILRQLSLYQACLLRSVKDNYDNNDDDDHLDDNNNNNNNDDNVVNDYIDQYIIKS